MPHSVHRLWWWVNSRVPALCRPLLARKIRRCANVLAVGMGEPLEVQAERDRGEWKRKKKGEKNVSIIFLDFFFFLFTIMEGQESSTLFLSLLIFHGPCAHSKVSPLSWQTREQTDTPRMVFIPFPFSFFSHKRAYLHKLSFTEVNIQQRYSVWIRSITK